MSASVIYLAHALVPQKRRIEHVSPRSIRSLAPDWRRPHIALLDGQAILRKDWDRTLHHGQVLAFVDVEAIPQGGKGGSNPLRMILMMAVMIFAPYAGAYVGGNLLGAELATGSLSLLAVEQVSILAGMALVNALIPPPKLPSPQQATALAAASPTYSLQAQGNTARLEAAIPEHFGRLPGYPDFAAMPYQEFFGNEQYLYQLLCLGRGEYDVEAIRIEDTPISSFDEIDYEVIPPGGSVTLFPSNVVSSPEVSGQDLPCATGTYAQSGTTITVTQTAHGLSTGKIAYLDFTSGTASDGNYTVDTAADADHFTVTAATSATTNGNVLVSPWLGPFVANAAETQANFIGIDLVMPRGIYHASTVDGSLSNVSITTKAEARAIDDNGNPLSAWYTIGTETTTLATTTPQRRSYRYSVPPGRYEVRVRREDQEQTASEYGHDVALGGLRAYLPETRLFGDVTLIAMRIKASNNLSMQASRKINVIATRKLPVWTGTAWSGPAATRSIAWALAYACKQVGLTDAQIDLATLQQLESTWATRGDYFDGRFDNFLSFWEAATKIVGVGRAKPYMQAGVMRVMRDQAATLPVALFSMRNIQRGSLSIDYLMPTADTADAVSVGYLDSSAWTQRRVPAKLPGSTAAKPAKIELWGVTSRDQAFREGMYQAACNRYRRKLIKFATEMEGFIPSFGDLIAIQHDMPAWGQHGESLGWDADSLTLTISEPLSWGVGTHYIGLRKRDGSVDGPYAVTPGATPSDVVLASPPSTAIYTGGNEERTHIAFGWAETWRQPARVLRVTPRGLYSVEIACVNEDSNVHTAEIGETTPPMVTTQLANYTNAPVILGFAARSMPGTPAVMLLTWQPSPWADHYVIEQSVDGLEWTRSGETSTSNYTATALYGAQTIVRVAAVGVAKGPWVQSNYSLQSDYMWSATDTDLMWDADDSTPMWSY